MKIVYSVKTISLFVLKFLAEDELYFYDEIHTKM